MAKTDWWLGHVKKCKKSTNVNGLLSDGYLRAAACDTAGSHAAFLRSVVDCRSRCVFATFSGSRPTLQLGRKNPIQKKMIDGLDHYKSGTFLAVEKPPVLGVLFLNGDRHRTTLGIGWAGLFATRSRGFRRLVAWSGSLVLPCLPVGNSFDNRKAKSMVMTLAGAAMSPGSNMMVSGFSIFFLICRFFSIF